MFTRICLLKVALTLCFAFLPARISATEPDTIWSTSYGIGGRTPSQVSIGDFTSQAFIAYGGNGGFVKLLSSFDSPNPTPIWQSNSIFEISSVKIASAANTDSHAMITRERSSSTNQFHLTIRYFKSSSNVEVWQFNPTIDITYTSAPAMNISVSSDGSRVIAWVFDIWSYRSKLYVLDGADGSLISSLSLDTAGEPANGILSGDDNYFLLAGKLSLKLMDAHFGTIVSQLTVNYSVTDLVSVARDGMKFVVSGNDGVVHGYKIINNIITQVFTINAPIANAGISKGAISQDGSLFIATFFAAGSSNVMTIQIYDIANDAPQMLHAQDFPAQSLTRITGASISSDNSRIVLISNGCEAPLVPEVLVYEKLLGIWTQTKSMDLVVPAWGMATGYDAGRTLIYSIGTVQPPYYLSYGEVRLIDTIRRDLKIFGIPRLGSTLTVTQAVPNNLAAKLFSSEVLTFPPINLGLIGNMYLTPGTIINAGIGIGNSLDQVTYQVPLPNASSQVGHKLNLQGFHRGPRTLTADFAHMTILP